MFFALFVLYLKFNFIPKSNQITLSALQSLQGGQPGQTILVKADNGQYQLLRIGPPAGAQQVTPGTLTTSSGNQTIRLQTVPAVSRFAGPPLALRKTITVSQAQTSTAVAQQQVKLTSKPSQNVMNNMSFDHKCHTLDFFVWIFSK